MSDILDQKQIDAAARAAEAIRRIVSQNVDPTKYKEVQAAHVVAAGLAVAAMVAARVI